MISLIERIILRTPGVVKMIPTDKKFMSYYFWTYNKESPSEIV